MLYVQSSPSSPISLPSSLSNLKICKKKASLHSGACCFHKQNYVGPWSPIVQQCKCPFLQGTGPEMQEMCFWILSISECFCFVKCSVVRNCCCCDLLWGSSKTGVLCICVLCVFVCSSICVFVWNVHWCYCCDLLWVRSRAKCFVYLCVCVFEFFRVFVFLCERCTDAAVTCCEWGLEPRVLCIFVSVFVCLCVCVWQIIFVWRVHWYCCDLLWVSSRAAWNGKWD